jgi:hypothetical protein
MKKYHPTKIAGTDQPLLSAFKLNQNYPNPFNPSTNISFYLPTPAKVKLEIFNLLGQKVTILTDKNYQAGNYQITWHASRHPSGIYFYQMTTGTTILTKKMLLQK